MGTVLKLISLFVTFSVQLRRDFWGDEMEIVSFVFTMYVGISFEIQLLDGSFGNRLTEYVSGVKA